MSTTLIGLANRWELLKLQKWAEVGEMQKQPVGFTIFHKQINAELIVQ